MDSIAKFYGPVAQLGERDNGIVEVMGSIPFRSTISNEMVRVGRTEEVLSDPAPQLVKIGSKI
jgi:hypothetical protein